MTDKYICPYCNKILKVKNYSDNLNSFEWFTCDCDKTGSVKWEHRKDNERWRVWSDNHRTWIEDKKPIIITKSFQFR
jgi:hypothetical protein